MSTPPPPVQSPFDRLLAIMHRLRTPGGCPWDAEQTHETLRPYLIEEAYEVMEAIETGSDLELCEELGDLLLQVVFHAELGSERDAFTIDDVATAISDKMVRRHPHVFGDVRVDSSEDVVANWAQIKAAEKAARPGGETRSALDGVPRALPALARAHRIGERAGAVGFDWPDAGGARAKIDEELRELDEAVSAGASDAVADELGDVLFAVASYSRLLGLNSENLLRNSLARFEDRFHAVEAEYRERGEPMSKASADELDEAWNRAKASLSGNSDGGAD